MTGNTNASIGGGVSPYFALIHATAPAGSTVTFSKDGITVRSIPSTEAIIKSSDSTRADYYFSVSPNNYGTWTVSTTANGYSTSRSVSVSAVREYIVDLRVLVIINNGVRSYGSWTATGCTITDKSGSYVKFTGSGTGYHLGFIILDLSPYNTLHYYRPQSGESVRIYQVPITDYNGSQTASGGGNGSWNAIDVSTYFGPYKLGGYTTYTNSCYIQYMYLT